jgi:hypothetical protein
VLEQSRAWPSPFKEEGELFFRSCEVHAVSQDWYLIGLDELIEQSGDGAGKKIWDALRSTRFNGGEVPAQPSSRNL